MENVEFKDKIVLVTGATSGIGQATAVALSKLGAILGIVGRSKERLIETAEKCVERPLCLQADFKIDNDVKCVAKAFMEHYKKIDILINCAGVVEQGSIEETSMDQYDRIMRTNIRGMFHITMLLIEELIKSRGCILNISGGTRHQPDPNTIVYNMAKAAVDQFTKCVAMEVGPKGVRCNAVSPGAIVTKLYTNGGLAEQKYQEFLEKEMKANALGKVGDVKDIVNAILFLLSDNATFITGITLQVDGGRCVMSPNVIL